MTGNVLPLETHGIVVPEARRRRNRIPRCSEDRSVRVWDERRHPVGAPLVGHLGAVNAVAAGRFRDRDVIVSGSDDRTVRVWGEELCPLGGPYPFLDPVTALAFHPLGLVVAAGPALILMAPDAR